MGLLRNRKYTTMTGNDVANENENVIKLMFSVEIPIVTRTCVLETCGLCLLAVSWTHFVTLDNTYSNKSFKNYSNIFLKTALWAFANESNPPSLPRDTQESGVLTIGSSGHIVCHTRNFLFVNPFLSIHLPDMIIR